MIWLAPPDFEDSFMQSKELLSRQIPPLVIGACEWVGLPLLGIAAVRARVDTGARSCALHASDQTRFTKDGLDWVSFRVHMGFERVRRTVECTSLLIGMRRVRNTSGEIEERFTIQTPIVIGEHHWPVEITLTNREHMRYRMLLGRAAMKNHAIVYPARTFLQGKPDIRAYQGSVHAHSNSV